jgi:hypothetical protein
VFGTENTPQGFWNGSQPPFGYRAIAAEKRGNKVKKVLAIDDAEMALVRRIYDLALGSTGMPLGVKAIVNRMNSDGDQNRRKSFHISSVHRILTSATYTGVHQLNRIDTRTGRTKATDSGLPSLCRR